MKKQLKILAITGLLFSFTACYSSKETTTTPRKRKVKNVSLSFKQMDVNKDGRISRIEAKGRLKENFKLRDKNNDGFITKNEMIRK